MILYFSGTGNSRYVAESIGNLIDDRVVSINDIMKSGSKEVLQSESPFVFVAPIYTGRIPRVLESFIKDADFSGSQKAYLINICGESASNAGQYIKKICEEKGIEFLGSSTVLMPANYIMMYEPTNKEKSEIMINNAKPQISEIADTIKSGKLLPKESVSSADKFKSSAVNSIFYKFMVTAKGFNTNEKCIACGECAKLCPLNNIIIKDGKPKWGDNCTHCTACINGCPQNAIEFKKATKNRTRYYNTKVPNM